MDMLSPGIPDAGLQSEEQSPGFFSGTLRIFRMAALLHPLGAGRQIAVDRAVILIGRSAECDVVLDCSSRISRIHCAIVQVDSDYYLRDLGSMNGVWIGDQRIVKEQKLQNGVAVSIGDLRFLFLDNVTVVPKQPQMHAAGSNGPVQVLVQPGNNGLAMQAAAPTLERPESSQRISASEITLGPLSLQELSEAVNEDSASAGMPNESDDATIQASEEEFFDDVEVLSDEDDAEPGIFSDLELIEDVEVIEEVEIIEIPSHLRRKPHKNS